jgi:mRNA interferase MazF
MTPCNPGDVVLVRFPFTDLATLKKRPALIVSPVEFSARFGDVVLLAMTGQDQQDESLRLRNWRLAGLVRPTWFKPLIGTLSATLVERRLGALDREDRLRAVDALRLLIVDEFALRS